MDWPALLLKLVHVALAIAFIAGLIGRWIILRRAAAAEDVELSARFAEAAAPFERLVVQGSGAAFAVGLLTAWAQGYAWLGLTTGWMLLSVVLLLSIMLLVPLVFLPRGRVFEAAMTEARRLGQVTPELRAAFADSRVAFARRYETAVVAVVVALMVLKPL